MCCSLKTSLPDRQQAAGEHDEQIMLLYTMQPTCRQRNAGLKKELLHLHSKQIEDSALHRAAATDCFHPEIRPADTRGCSNPLCSPAAR